MNLRPFGSIVALALSTAVFGGFTGYSSSALAAGEKDKDAMKLHDAALDEDYLNLELDKAEKKLKDLTPATVPFRRTEERRRGLARLRRHGAGDQT